MSEKWRVLGDSETIPIGKRWRVVLEPTKSIRDEYDADCQELGEELCVQLEIEHGLRGDFENYEARVEVCDE